MEYAEGVKNIKSLVTEFMSETDEYATKKYHSYTLRFPLSKAHLRRTSMLNVWTICSIQYHPQYMKMFKASGIGDGVSISHKKLF